MDEGNCRILWPHAVLAALMTASKAPARPEDCIAVLRAKLRGTPDDIPDDLDRVRELHEEIARAYHQLAVAGLVDPDGEGRFAITPSGVKLLASHPKGIDDSVLEHYPAYRAYISASARSRPRGRSRAEGVVHEPEPAYVDGLASYQLGLELTDNPHDSDSAAHLEWGNGWSDAHSGAPAPTGRKAGRAG